ncbi:hypothetical protein [uncultured Winogradskyella sp.]|uniref:hypothetical protein n=1 Tax=uncultured Winogradskyella sp. TaxID=395353 RepID=UPI0030DC3DAB|tara:strand:+ start:12116 stop:12775 length:660 start_codon:yes stop_codon:yes gene_type:complete
MRYLYLLLFLVCLGCNNKRILELPELENAETTTVLDVSPAYIFYDDTQPDSTLLNRKNLIITTNWLVNVDKRLTLKQAIPHIKFLQDKKRNAEMHKNENAKNYFTCNDTSIGNLGFLEFTNVNYLNSDNSVKDNLDELSHLIVFDLSDIQIISNSNVIYNATTENLASVLQKKINADKDLKTLLLTFNENLIFQDYIDIKAILKPFEQRISKYEFIFQP